MICRFLKSLFYLFTLLAVIVPAGAIASPVSAEGDYYSIGTPTAQDSSYDAVSWSTGSPITIDQYGKMIVPVQIHTVSKINLAVSNNDGKTWFEITGSSGYFRPTLVYDPVNDKLHMLSASTLGTVYRQFAISRDSANNILALTLNTEIGTSGALTLDGNSGGTCGTVDAKNPILLLKSNGGNGILVAIWSVVKTCGVTNLTQNRMSMRTLSNTSADGVAGNWVGAITSGTGYAAVGYDLLYGYAGAYTNGFMHGAIIRGGSGARANDIYYFNADENDTHGFRRLSWNSIANNWSGTWTARATFGGDVSGTGYNLNQELMSKPVYDPINDRIYVGIARWLDATNGDTQSLYYADSSDAMQLAGNVYSAGGAAFLYPTLDISIDESSGLLYFFYLTSGGANNGHVYYKTYDGSAFSGAVAYYTKVGETADIPIVYYKKYNNKLILFFRKNKTSNPNLPPHEIFFGSVDLSGTTPATTGTYAATSNVDFYQRCATFTDTEMLSGGTGDVRLEKVIDDSFSATDFLSFSDRWTWGTFDAGTYTPAPVGGELVVYDSSKAYILSNNFRTLGALAFRAKFTAHNFQHVGYAIDTSFGRYAMFSTGSNGQLNARTEAGAGETITALGSSYLGAFHTYRIEWAASEIRYYIDSTLVATHAITIANTMSIIASNSTVTAGSDLTLDWITSDEYIATTGTYIGCTINSGMKNTVWSDLASLVTTPAGTGNVIQARTSTDNVNWTSWTTVADGNPVTTLGRFLQYRSNLSGTSLATPLLSSVSLNYGLPTIQFTTSTSTKAEGSGSTTLGLVLSNALSEDVTVAYAGSGTASSGSDYTMAGSTATITSGNTTTTIPLSIDSDSTYEGDETLIVTLSSPTLARLGTNATHTITITDDDVAPTPTPTSSSTTSSSTSSTSTSSAPPSCDKEKPGAKAPLLFGASATGNDAISLTVAPGDKPFDHYILQYGDQSGSYPFGTTLTSSGEVQTFMISSLKSATTYYFRIRGGNNCATGEWSNEISVTTFEAFGQNMAKLTSTITPIPELDEIASEANSEIGNNESTPVETPASALAKSGYKVAIKVADPEGKLLTNAKVTLHSTPRTTTTNAQGIANFDEVEPGEHTIIVEHDNFKGEQKIVLAGTTETFEVNITVTPQNPFLDWRVAVVLGIISLVAIIFGIKLLMRRKNQN